MMFFSRAFWIAKPYLREITRNRSTFVILAIGCLLTCLVHWDPEKNILGIGPLEFPEVSVEQGEDRILSVFFYELISWSWIGFMVFFFVQHILYPLANSFSASQTLWLRLTPASSLELAFARLIVVAASMGWIGAQCFALGLFYSIMHGQSLPELMLPVLGLMSHILFASGIILVFRLTPTTSASTRAGVVFIALLTPVVLSIIGNQLTEAFHGFFPYTSPFITESTGNSLIGAERPFLMAGAVGVLLVILHLLTATTKLYLFVHQKPKII